MFLREGECVERGDESRFPALFNRKVVAGLPENASFLLATGRMPLSSYLEVGILLI
jgi:hypothetical protein